MYFGKQTKSLNEDQIKNLVYKVKNNGNDKESFTTLYNVYVNDIQRFFRNRVPYSYDVHDLTNETFTIMLSNINKLEKDECFHSWLFGIALNLLRKYYKKKRLELNDFLENKEDKDSSLNYEIPSNDPLPDILMDKKYIQDYLEELIKGLKKEQRLALYLRFYQEMKLKEIATAMNKSEEAVKSLLFRSQRTLFKLMTKKYRSNIKNSIYRQVEMLGIYSDS